MAYLGGVSCHKEKVIKAIEKKFNRFLWNGSELGTAKARVFLRLSE